MVRKQIRVTVRYWVVWRKSGEHYFTLNFQITQLSDQILFIRQFFDQIILSHFWYQFWNQRLSYRLRLLILTKIHFYCGVGDHFAILYSHGPFVTIFQSLRQINAVRNSILGVLILLLWNSFDQLHYLLRNHLFLIIFTNLHILRRLKRWDLAILWFWFQLLWLFERNLLISEH